MLAKCWRRLLEKRIVSVGKKCCVDSFYKNKFQKTAEDKNGAEKCCRELFEKKLVKRSVVENSLKRVL